MRKGLAIILTGGLLLSGTGALAATGNANHYTLTSPSYSFQAKRDVVTRWNPCVTLRFKINPGALGATGINELRTAAARVARATGLPMSYAGTTTYVPTGRARTAGGRTSYVWDGTDMQRRTGVPLVLAFVRNGGSNLYDGGESGQGGWESASSTSKGAQIAHGFAMVRPDAGLRAGFAAGGSRGVTAQHELGHAVGLDHYSDPIMVMNPVSTRQTPADFNNGDLTGLRRVGRAAGCITP